MHQAIRFRFNAKKAAQAASKLLRLSGKRRNYMELVKLLYIADRTAILNLHSPITGDRMAALPHGLVLSHILDLIRRGPANPEDSPWFDAVSAPIGYDVVSLRDCEDGELSGEEDQILSEVFDKYGKLDWKELSAVTHGFPEYTDPDGSSLPISPEQLLQAGGAPQKEIEAISRELALFASLDEEIARFEGREFQPQTSAP